jgi:hypothetical protein
MKKAADALIVPLMAVLNRLGGAAGDRTVAAMASGWSPRWRCQRRERQVSLAESITDQIAAIFELYV